MNMTITRRALLAGGAATLAACSTGPVLRTYDGPAITSVIAVKQKRALMLLNGQTVMRSLHFELGFNPVGHKQFKGDGKTPEGTYRINRRNPNSAYHLSIGISYPNTTDWEYAQSLGRDPGGDIFIHGTPDTYLGKRDWTAGCVAVTTREIEDVYAMVRDGTPVFLYA